MPSRATVPGTPPLIVSGSSAPLPGVSLSAPEPRPAVATPTERKSFGRTGAPVTLGVVDPAARWVFFCQDDIDQSSVTASATGAPLELRVQTDAMSPYLAGSSSNVIKLTALLATSADGRYLVVLSEAHEPLLVDAQSEDMTSLATLELDLRADAMRGDLRSVAFSADSSKVAFLLRGQPPRILIRQLHSGTDVEVTPVGDNVWRIEFDAASRYLVLQEILDDTNGNGRFDWPIPERPLRNTRCMADLGSLDAWPLSGDRAITTIAPVAGGKAQRVDGFVTSLESSLIVKRGREGLTAIDESGTRPISNSDCDLHIIALSTRYAQILSICGDKKGHSGLELDSLGAIRKFSFEAPVSMLDWITPESDRFKALYSGTHTLLVDFQLASATQLQDRDQLLAQGTAGIILRRGAAVVLFTPDASTTVTLMDGLAAGTRVMVGPGHAIVGQSVLSANLGKVLGVVAQPTMAIAANGCVLVALGVSQNDRPFVAGPLQWICLNSPHFLGIRPSPNPPPNLRYSSR